MNERIEKLIAKSKLENLDGFAQYEVDAIYNLAELIVKECAEICLEANDHKNILRHFGVEE